MKLSAAVLGVTDIARARKSHSNFPTVLPLFSRVVPYPRTYFSSRHVNISQQIGLDIGITAWLLVNISKYGTLPKSTVYTWVVNQTKPYRSLWTLIKDKARIPNTSESPNFWPTSNPPTLPLKYWDNHWRTIKGVQPLVEATSLPVPCPTSPPNYRPTLTRGIKS